MLYFIIAIGIILQALFIKVEHDEKYVAADILKGSAALMFVIVGFLGMKKGLNPGFADKIFTGLSSQPYAILTNQDDIKTLEDKTSLFS